MENHSKTAHAHPSTAGTLRWSIATAVSLLILKTAAGLLTHSMAIFASALDSAMDAASSTVNFVAAREAAKPPDEGHAYGHGKIESLAALFQSLFIGASGLFLIVESFRRLVRGTHLYQLEIGVGVMAFSMFLSAALVWRLKSAQKKTGSLILATESLHYNSDIFANLGVIAALGLVRLTNMAFWDLLFSIAVSGYIFRTSYMILRRAVDELLDHSLPPVSKEDIEKIILGTDRSIVGLHNFRSRRVGGQVFMDFHIEIRGEHDFQRAHDKTEALISRIRLHYPGSDITVHYDPEGAV